MPTHGLLVPLAQVLFAFARQRKVEPTMANIGGIIAVLGLLGVIWGAIMMVKAGRISKAPLFKTGEASSQGAAGAKRAISVEGAVQCPTPLVSPVTGTECLYYECSVSAKWKTGETNHSKDVIKDKQAAPFTVDDGSGPVRIDAASGGSFDLEKTFEKSQGGGLVGTITGNDIVFQNLRVSPATAPQGAKFTVVERVLRVAPKLFVCGQALEGGGIGSPKWASLIISHRSREELVGATGKTAKLALAAGATALILGVILVIYGRSHDARPGPAHNAENAVRLRVLDSKSELSSLGRYVRNYPT